MPGPKADRRQSPERDGQGAPLAIPGPVRPAPDVDGALAALARAPLESLRELWARRYGRPPPRSLSRRLLQYAAAYEIQAKISGGLTPALRRKLLQASAKKPAPGRLGKTRKPQATPPAGSRLVRDWHGRSHTVEVTDRGFLYAGRHYRSLSEVARAITGARWSGPRFFGL
jgi:Protein of unknown function (DUF2924)